MSMPPAGPRPIVFCPACNGPLKAVGRLPIRRDATEAGFFIPAQPGDNQAAIGVDAYRCHDCGRLELYDHDFQLPSF